MTKYKILFNTPTQIEEQDMNNIISLMVILMFHENNSAPVRFIYQYALKNYPTLLTNYTIEDLPVKYYHQFKVDQLLIRYATIINIVAIKESLTDLIDLFRSVYKMYYKPYYKLLNRLSTFTNEKLLSALEDKDFTCDGDYMSSIAIKCIYGAIILNKPLQLNKDMYKFNLDACLTEGWKCDLTTTYKKVVDKINDTYNANIKAIHLKWYEWAKKNKTDFKSLVQLVSIMQGTDCVFTEESDERAIPCRPTKLNGFNCIYGLALGELWYKALYPRRKPTFENIKTFAAAATIQYGNAISFYSAWLDCRNTTGFKDELDEYELGEMESYCNLMQVCKNKESVGEGEYYKNKIEELESQITNLKQQQCKEQLKELKRTLENTQKQLTFYKTEHEKHTDFTEAYEELLERYDAEHQELLKLRELTYECNIEQEVKEEQELSVEEMAELIEDYNLLLVGGHTNMLSRLKARFPNWTYIQPENYVSYNKKTAGTKDYIFVITCYVKHSVVEKFEHPNVPLEYINTVNFNTVVKRIYDVLSRM